MRLFSLDGTVTAALTPYNLTKAPVSLDVGPAPIGSYSLREQLRQLRTGVPHEQLARLAEQTPINAAVTLSLVLVVSVCVLILAPTPLLFVWGPLNVGIALVILVRWWNTRYAINQIRDIDMRPSRKGVRNGMLFGLLSGGLWGSLTALLPEVPQHVQFALILCMGGMAAGASTTLAAVPQVAFIFILGCSAPLIGYFFWQGDLVSHMVALNFTVFTAAMIGTSQMVYATLLRQLRAEKQAQFLRESHLQQRIAAAANESGDLDEALHTCLEEICHYIAWPAGHVWLLADDGSGKLVSSNVWYLNDPSRFSELQNITRNTQFSAGSGFPGRVFAEGKPLWRGDFEKTWETEGASEGVSTRKDFPRTEALVEAGIKGISGYPIMVGSNVVGVMDLFTEARARPSSDVSNVLDTAATQIGRAIERHRSEQEMRASEARFRALVEHSNQGFSVHDHGKPLYVNDYGARMIGYTAEEFLALDSIYEVVHPKDQARLRQYGVDQDKGLPIPSIYEFTAVRPDGEEVPCLAQVSAIGWDGKDSVLMAVVDMTEQRNTEALLHQAQKMEAVGQLTSGVAHDFNNVLTIVMGNLELALKRVNDDKIVELLSAAVQGAQKGADLNRQLLTFSRQEAFEEKVSDVNLVIGGMTELVHRTLGEAIKIVTSLRAEGCFAKLDPAQLESAVLNLSINARDAMESGGTLEIKTALVNGNRVPGAEATATRYVDISVGDTGSGMSPEVRERALEPFFTTKGVGRGTGLGLAMIYGFVQKSGGQMDIRSEEGVGTEIHLFLPLCDPPEAHIVDAVETTPEAKADGECILVVEDQPEVMTVVHQYLEDLGYRILTATDAQQALSQVEKADGQIDLLLTDMMLPGGMDGAQLIGQVRESIPAIKAIIMSGNLAQADGDEDRDLSDIPLLRKPFRQADLGDALGKCRVRANEEAL